MDITICIEGVLPVVRSLHVLEEISFSDHNYILFHLGVKLIHLTKEIVVKPRLRRPKMIS